MRIKIAQKTGAVTGSIFAYLLFLLLVVSCIAAIGAYVVNTSHMTNRRTQTVSAMQLAEGGAALAAADLAASFTNGSTPFLTSLTTRPSGPYVLNSALSTANENVYQRTITTTFSQSVTAQIWLTNSPNPNMAKVVATATVGQSTQSATVHLAMRFGYTAAIISDHPGTTSTGVSKGTAQDGNVVVDGNKKGATVVDGGDAKAIWSNGRANVDLTYATVPASAISMTNYNTSNQIPDYTADGSMDQLFDFNRFIAVAQMSGNHYTNLSSFVSATKTGTVLEGVIVVNVKKSEMGTDLSTKSHPNGINIRGTLVFNFAADVGPSDKLVNTATMNINAANLTGLIPSVPSTYTTGYPPVYTNPAKNPANVEILSTKGFPNFSAADDLPALMYNVGILDLHGSVNICGVVYSPSFMEIENKQDGQIQYFRGSLIGGGGIFVENGKNAISIVSYDRNSLDLLATANNKGKKAEPLYWE